MRLILSRMIRITKGRLDRLIREAFVGEEPDEIEDGPDDDMVALYELLSGVSEQLQSARAMCVGPDMEAMLGLIDQAEAATGTALDGLADLVEGEW